MIFAMGVGLTLLYLLIRFTKRLDLARRGSPRDGGIKVLTSKLIAPQKYVSLVEIGGEILALGISAQQVTFLTKIENKAFIEKMESRGPVRADVFSFLHSVRFPLKSKKPKAGFLRRVYGR